MRWIKHYRVWQRLGPFGVWRAGFTSTHEHPELGTLSPDIQKVAKALAGRDRIRLQPAGVYAANLLGLSEQVPAKAVFLTDGPSRTVKIGRQEIQLRRTTPRTMAAAGRLSGMLMQAFRHLGREHITPRRIAHLKRTLPAKERKQLIKDLPLAPAWMHPFFENWLRTNRETGILQLHRRSSSYRSRSGCWAWHIGCYGRKRLLGFLHACGVVVHSEFSEQLLFKGGTSPSKCLV